MLRMVSFEKYRLIFCLQQPLFIHFQNTFFIHQGLRVEVVGMCDMGAREQRGFELCLCSFDT